MKKNKEARLSWNKPSNSWIIRLWSEGSQDWKEDSCYPVKDVDPETECGWVSETLVTRLYDLRDLGYEILLF